MARYPFTCALVTGASSGIGHEMAVKLAASRGHVIAVARRADQLKHLARQFKYVEVMVADLTSAVGLASVEARIADASLTPIDLVVNNAGFDA